jgi:hypothetical protein
MRISFGTGFAPAEVSSVQYCARRAYLTLFRHGCHSGTHGGKRGPAICLVLRNQHDAVIRLPGGLRQTRGGMN